MRRLTEEDRAAWFDWQVNPSRDWQLWEALERISVQSDESDAHLVKVLLKTWLFVSSLGCTRAEWWQAFRNDVERIAARV